MEHSRAYGDSRTLADTLSHRDLTEVLAVSDACLTCGCEESFSELLLGFARFIGFEYLLYAYMQTRYDRDEPVLLVNLSNPEAWMEEYAQRSYVETDPVRVELERRLAAGETHGVILWDAYDRELGPMEEEIIARRTEFGLRYGFSAFCDSPRHDSIFLVSFASAAQQADARAQLLGRFVVPHFNRCRKRLDLLNLVNRLTDSERRVARWLVEGKTNWEIAQILEVSERTAKYHVANILSKLQAATRQGAVAILIAERYLA